MASPVCQLLCTVRKKVNISSHQDVDSQKYAKKMKCANISRKISKTSGNITPEIVVGNGSLDHDREFGDRVCELHPAGKERDGTIGI